MIFISKQKVRTFFFCFVLFPLTFRFDYNSSSLIQSCLFIDCKFYYYSVIIIIILVAVHFFMLFLFHIRMKERKTNRIHLKWWLKILINIKIYIYYICSNNYVCINLVDKKKWNTQKYLLFCFVCLAMLLMTIAAAFRKHPLSIHFYKKKIIIIN